MKAFTEWQFNESTRDKIRERYGATSEYKRDKFRIATVVDLLEASGLPCEEAEYVPGRRTTQEVRPLTVSVTGASPAVHAALKTAGIRVTLTEDGDRHMTARLDVGINTAATNTGLPKHTIAGFLNDLCHGAEDAIKRERRIAWATVLRSVGMPSLYTKDGERIEYGLHE